MNDNILRIYASFTPSSGRLSVIYCTAGEPTDDDGDECELTCGELIAEFPEIISADTKCVPIKDCRGEEENLVYYR